MALTLSFFTHVAQKKTSVHAAACKTSSKSIHFAWKRYLCEPESNLSADPDTDEGVESDIESICVDARRKDGEEDEEEEEKEKEGEEKREGRSRSSSASSEDYIIILPDCFDTSRPLGESMYRCAHFLKCIWNKKLPVT